MKEATSARLPNADPDWNCWKSRVGSMIIPVWKGFMSTLPPKVEDEAMPASEAARKS